MSGDDREETCVLQTVLDDAAGQKRVEVHG